MDSGWDSGGPISAEDARRLGINPAHVRHGWSAPDPMETRALKAEARLRRAERLRSEFADWLARTGYGIDYSNDVDPPVTLTELAEAWHRLDPDDGMTVEDWAWCITENTGAYSSKPRDPA